MCVCVLTGWCQDDAAIKHIGTNKLYSCAATCRQILLCLWQWLTAKCIMFAGCQSMCDRALSLWTRYFTNHLREFHQIYNSGAARDENELYGQKVEVTAWSNMVIWSIITCSKMQLSAEGTVYQSTVQHRRLHVSTLCLDKKWTLK